MLFYLMHHKKCKKQERNDTNMNKQINGYVTWVGKTDWELKKFHGDEFTTTNGSSYNAYLIKDEKTILIDTVWLPYD